MDLREAHQEDTTAVPLVVLLKHVQEFADQLLRFIQPVESSLLGRLRNDQRAIILVECWVPPIAEVERQIQWSAERQAAGLRECHLPGQRLVAPLGVP